MTFPMSEESQGTYECLASNTFGSIRKKISVTQVGKCVYEKRVNGILFGALRFTTFIKSAYGRPCLYLIDCNLNQIKFIQNRTNIFCKNKPSPGFKNSFLCSA